MLNPSRPTFGWILLVLLGLTGCSEPTPPPPADELSAADEVAAPENAVSVDFPHTLHHIRAADLDGDGRLDLTLASHVSSWIESFYQETDRSFSASGPLKNPGFHPNGTLVMTDDEGQGYILLNAETANAVRTYRASRGAAADFIGEVPAPAPELSILVDWPSWGNTLAVVPKTGAQLHLHQGFRPSDPATARLDVIELSERSHLRLAGLTAADLDGSGTPALIVSVLREGRLVAIRPASPDKVRVDDIWSFDRSQFLHVVLPVDFDGDGLDDLILLGEQKPDATLLLSDGKGGFTERRFPILAHDAQRGVQSAELTRESDGSLLLWAFGERGLVVLRWGSDRSQPPERFVYVRPGPDKVRLAAADLDGDGHEDLVMGSSVGFVPTTVLYGPLLPRLDEIGAWLGALARQEDAAREAARSVRMAPTAADRETE
jgi:hypothetical protein